MRPSSCRPQPTARTRGRRARLVSALLALALVTAGCGPAPAKLVGPLPVVDGTPTVQPSAVPPAPPPPPDPARLRAEALAAAPAPPPPEDPPASRAALEAWLAPRLAGAVARFGPDTSLAVLVTDEHGREVVSHRPDAPVLPASTLKVVTAAAVLVTLGPDGVLHTHLDATAPIGPDGVLAGDLVLRGVGDPTLVTDEYARWIYPSRPRVLLDDLADALVDQGLTVVAGDVLAEVTGFEPTPRAAGWRDNYLHDLDARYVSGLTVDAGLQTLIIYPEPEPEEGEGEDEGEDPADAGQAEDAETDGTAEPVPPGPPDVRVRLVADPAQHTVDELVRLLTERGVEVHGQPRVGRPVDPVVGRLGTLTSPPMAEVLRFAVQRSDNHLSDQLFLVVGRLRTGAGDWDTGDRGLRQALDHLGVDHDGAHFADGSGLSRDDRVTARLLVDLDRVMRAGPHAEVWASLMAVTGESGTLRDRLRGTPASGRFEGKTGTLRDVTSLTGAVVAADGARYHLAVLAEDAVGGGRWAARVLMDELILALVADVDACERATAAGDDTVLGLPPVVVRCP